MQDKSILYQDRLLFRVHSKALNAFLNGLSLAELFIFNA
jgi:hypothetical protein